MKYYFQLQLKMLNRQLSEWGFEPILGYILGIVVFIFFSIRIFESTQFAEYLYLIIVLSLIIKLNDVGRIDFLNICFSKSNYIKIRIIENLIVSIMFISFLLFQKKYISSLILFISIFIFSFFDLKSKSSFTIPTPFYKYPFEFVVGFRADYFVHFCAYFLTFMSIYYDNFNLGLFSLVLTCLICVNYYTKTENQFYVWIFSLTPKQFLNYKLQNIIQYSFILCFPTLLSLCVYFPSKIDLILGFQCLGYLFIYAVMIAKYSVFPEKLNIRLMIVFGLVIWFPIMLVIIIPYLYIQSIKKLNEILL